MKGNSLITTMVLLVILSSSVLYSARESLLAAKSSAAQIEAFQLEALIDETQFYIQQLIEGLPQEITPVDWQACKHTPCVITAVDANFFLEQQSAWYLANDNPALIWLTLPNARAALVLEYLTTLVDAEGQTMQQYLRGTVFMISNSRKSLLRMQTTWNRTVALTTLKSKPVAARLAWRRP
jgi:hypothetical protein